MCIIRYFVELIDIFGLVDIFEIKLFVVGSKLTCNYYISIINFGLRVFLKLMRFSCDCTLPTKFSVKSWNLVWDGILIAKCYVRFRLKWHCGRKLFMNPQIHGIWLQNGEILRCCGWWIIMQSGFIYHHGGCSLRGYQTYRWILSHEEIGKCVWWIRVVWGSHWGYAILCSSDDAMIMSFFVDSFIHVGFFVAMQVDM